MAAVATLSSIQPGDLPYLVHDEWTDTPSVPDLIVALRSTDQVEREDALASLAEVVDTAFGEDGMAVGEEVRRSGGVALLTWLIADPCHGVQQTSLMVLGNLCSDSVDADSYLTKRLLLHCGGWRAVFSCVHTEDSAILLFAVGALQNLCFDRDWADLCVSHGVHRRLEVLLSHEDTLIVRYASGALQNMSRSLQLSDLSESAMQLVKSRSMEHRLESYRHRRALCRIAQAMRQVPEPIRRRRQERGAQRRRNDNLANSERTETWSWATSSWSRPSTRPSSGASSRSAASSYVSARSSAVLGS